MVGNTQPLREPAAPNPILRYFTYAHLSTRSMRDVSERFFSLAHALDDILPNGPEKSVALRKLLESKDAAVRAAIDVYIKPSSTH